METRTTASPRVRSWTNQIRTQGFDALWARLSDPERKEFEAFALEFDQLQTREASSRWQSAVDGYKSLAEKFPPYADIAVSRAAFIVSEKINRSIRYYNSGVQALGSRQYLKALQYFDLAISVDPHMEKAHYNLGVTHKFLYVGDPSGQKLSRIAALDAFKRLLQINPSHAKAAAQITQLQNL